MMVKFWVICTTEDNILHLPGYYYMKDGRVTSDINKAWRFPSKKAVIAACKDINKLWDRSIAQFKIVYKRQPLIEFVMNS